MKKWSPLDGTENRVIADYLAGKRMSDIAASAKISVPTLRKFVRNQGCEKRPTGGSSRMIARGRMHKNFKGGVLRSADRYLRELEHRIVMARNLGRPLNRWDSVDLIAEELKSV
jgi:hypothetical protein